MMDQNRRLLPRSRLLPKNKSKNNSKKKQARKVSNFANWFMLKSNSCSHFKHRANRPISTDPSPETRFFFKHVHNRNHRKHLEDLGTQGRICRPVISSGLQVYHQTEGVRLDLARLGLRLFLLALVMGPCWIRVGSVLQALFCIRYMTGI